MGGSQFQVVKIYAAAKGIDLGKDITVVNANFARRARAARGRPRRRGAGDRAAGEHQRQAASGLARHLQRRARLEGNHRRSRLGDRPRDARRCDRKKSRTRRRCCSPRCRTSPTSCTTNTADADKIANETLKLPPGILTAAVESKRLQMIVKPAWEPATRKSITDMMERAVKAGFYPKDAGREDHLCPMRSTCSGAPVPSSGSDLPATDPRLPPRLCGLLGGAVASGAGPRHSAVRHPEPAADRAKASPTITPVDIAVTLARVIGALIVSFVLGVWRWRWRCTARIRSKNICTR